MFKIDSKERLAVTDNNIMNDWKIPFLNIAKITFGLALGIAVGGVFTFIVKQLLKLVL